MIRQILPALFCILASAAFGADANRDAGVRVHDIRVGQGDRKIRVSLAVFDENKFSIRIIDNAAAGDRARFDSLAIAMEQLACVAGCNGGFFTRQPFEPFGFMISDGREFGKFDPESWMNGLLVVRGDHPTIESSRSLKTRYGITGLLQSGPWLIRAGASEPGLDKDRQAPRTFICHDSHGIWAIGTSERCSLQELAALLAHTDLRAAIDIQQALNLDGGPSTGLWVKKAPANFYVREGWPVRNYIGIVPRP